jgi:hypothetical protein
MRSRRAWGASFAQRVTSDVKASSTSRLRAVTVAGVLTLGVLAALNHVRTSDVVSTRLLLAQLASVTADVGGGATTWECSAVTGMLTSSACDWVGGWDELPSLPSTLTCDPLLAGLMPEGRHVVVGRALGDEVQRSTATAPPSLVPSLRKGSSRASVLATVDVDVNVEEWPWQTKWLHDSAVEEWPWQTEWLHDSALVTSDGIELPCRHVWSGVDAGMAFETPATMLCCRRGVLVPVDGH